MLPLIVGTLLAAVAVAYVLYPLLFGSAPGPRRPIGLPLVAPAPDEDAIVALREIEFDRATGKLSDADYTELKSRYTARALAAMRARGEAGADASPEDLVEATVLAYRARLKSCARCGPRPEPDAIFCSNCGAYLDETCAGCGRVVEEAGAAFCAGCGRQLAA
ncbi:MAG: zinc ribbon domain-containing protein [Gemmatimonadetes bacterium]|nr:zinc ribbon domain-containing protein [Gemmatimonadota bacterium]